MFAIVSEMVSGRMLLVSIILWYRLDLAEIEEIMTLWLIIFSRISVTTAVSWMLRRLKASGGMPAKPAAFPLGSFLMMLTTVAQSILS